MSVSKKIRDHVINNSVGSMANGAKFAHRLTEGQGVVAEALGAFIGASIGALIGGYKLISPTSIAETMMRSDEEIDKRTEDLFKP